jgi:6,7-dimethyl-8-ribityllumazine synthase
MSSKQFDNSNKEFKLLNPDKLKIACVVSEWHNEITEKLFMGAKNILIKNGVQEKKYF